MNNILFFLFNVYSVTRKKRKKFQNYLLKEFSSSWFAEGQDNLSLRAQSLKIKFRNLKYTLTYVLCTWFWPRPHTIIWVKYFLTTGNMTTNPILENLLSNLFLELVRFKGYSKTLMGRLIAFKRGSLPILLKNDALILLKNMLMVYALNFKKKKILFFITIT